MKRKTRKKRPPKITTYQQAKRVVKIVVGFTVVLIGIAGLFLPVLQGIFFIILGFAILGTEYVWARRLMKRFKKQTDNVKNSFFSNTSKGSDK
ncbi:MAG: PGPGW domain-containing protein [Candidatus Mariimomonas ferrooxydans]